MNPESHPNRGRAEPRVTALLVLEGPGPRRQWPVGDRITIGRERGDIVIPDDPYLTKLHAQVESAGISHLIRDCGSTNGTFVQVRGPIELRPGDEILIGSQLFRVGV